MGQGREEEGDLEGCGVGSDIMPACMHSGSVYVWHVCMYAAVCMPMVTYNFLPPYINIPSSACLSPAICVNMPYACACSSTSISHCFSDMCACGSIYGMTVARAKNKHENGKTSTDVGGKTVRIFLSLSSFSPST